MLSKFKIVVKDDERAFLMRDGRFERLLGPCRFVAFNYGRRLTAETMAPLGATSLPNAEGTGSLSPGWRIPP